MSNPKKHHIIPASYLAGFTSDKAKRAGTRHGKLCVADLEKNEIRSSTPNNVEYQKNYYRVCDSKSPFLFEKFFGKLEDKIAPIIRKIANTNQIHKDEDFDLLMTLVAFLYVKGENFRKPYYEFQKRLTELIGEVSTECNYSEIEGDEFLARPASSNHTIMIPELIKECFPLLVKRKWFLFIAEKGTEFATSDNPVKLSWFDSSSPPTGLFSYGLGHPQAMVSVPLSKKLLFVGYDAIPSNSILSNPILSSFLSNMWNLFDVIPSGEVDKKTVANMNSQRFLGTFRSLYCSNKDKALFLKADETVCDLETILSEIKKKE